MKVYFSGRWCILVSVSLCKTNCNSLAPRIRMIHLRHRRLIFRMAKMWIILYNNWNLSTRIYPDILWQRYLQGSSLRLQWPSRKTNSTVLLERLPPSLKSRCTECCKRIQFITGGERKMKWSSIGGNYDKWNAVCVLDISWVSYGRCCLFKYKDWVIYLFCSGCIKARVYSLVYSWNLEKVSNETSNCFWAFSWP